MQFYARFPYHFGIDFVCVILSEIYGRKKDVAVKNIGCEHNHLLVASEQYVNYYMQVCRGTAVMLVSPTDGTDEIANPFIQPDGA